ncbi:tetrapyrrole-binding protein, chloroplastic [Selaginella moellendorffii]|nr:tetrapyrrole-binding protein, chloroplastic [Selaginella moellendorffii]|eukprot:XP_002974959.2 tetrapyrrole-binding protein, chloroplastic [Selaginella moellendorffii]
MQTLASPQNLSSYWPLHLLIFSCELRQVSSSSSKVAGLPFSRFGAQELPLSPQEMSTSISSSQCHSMLDPRQRYAVDFYGGSSRFARSSHSSRVCSYNRPCYSSIASSSTRLAAASSLRATAVDQEELSLDSSGVSYQVLKQRLEAGEWEAADEETRRLLYVLAGEAAAKRKWVYFSEAKFIPARDLQTLDSLWRQYSGNKFGYSVQRRIWKSVASNWSLFFRKVGWTRPLDEKNDAYRKFPVEFMWDVAKPTPDGHLPLTNCLRGTQLLQAILLHPAFDEIEKQEGMTSNLTGSSSTLL